MTQLNPSQLQFHSGSRDFDKEEFVNYVKPYFADLTRVGKTNFLCVFTYGNGDKADVTGYRSGTTLNVTNNSKILKSRQTGGTWAVFTLGEVES